MGQGPGLLAAPTLFAARYPGSLFHARPMEVLPGHGHPTNMEQVRRYSRATLEDLRDRIGAHLHEGGGLAEAYCVDPIRRPERLCPSRHLRRAGQQEGGPRPRAKGVRGRRAPRDSERAPLIAEQPARLRLDGDEVDQGGHADMAFALLDLALI